MKVLQLLAAGEGSAWDYDVFSLTRILRNMGFQTGVYAEQWDGGHAPEGVLPLSKLPKLNREDVILYHKSPEKSLSVSLEQFSCRKLLMFRGVNPPRFYKQDSPQRHGAAEQCMQELCQLAEQVDYAMAATPYHAAFLRELNYRCPIVVRPPMIPFSEYAQAPDADFLSRYGADGGVNLLFCGDLVPYHRQEEVLRAFFCYGKYCNPHARLFLAGADGEAPAYARRLKRYAQALGLGEQVIFTGQLTFSERLACYHLADLFLSMSACECDVVSLHEAIYFGVPVVARGTAVTPDTMGGSGLLLPTDDPMEAALAVDRVLRNPDLQREIVAGQRRQQQKLAYGTLQKQFEQQFRDFLDQTPVEEKRKLLAFRR